MSKKINELFGQALDKAVPETWTNLTPVQLFKLKEVFAEIIIQECSDVILSLYHKTPLEYAGVLITAESDIAKHFFESDNNIKTKESEKPIMVFNKEYDGESIVDLGRDISEMFEDAPVIPQDEYGIHKGTFTVTVKWEKE
jgi:hypothetical protein